MLIDSHLGTSCITIAAIIGTDYCLIAAEPTPFALSDMRMVVELLREQEVDFGVVANKSKLGNNDFYAFSEGIEVILEVPLDKNMVLSISDL